MSFILFSELWVLKAFANFSTAFFFFRISGSLHINVVFSSPKVFEWVVVGGPAFNSDKLLLSASEDAQRSRLTCAVTTRPRP